MTIRHSTFPSRATGREIHRISVPAPKSNSNGIILALHGLGDHIGCHEKAFEIFADLGYGVEGFDWPGNGKSEGRRGDIPGVRPALKLIWEVIESLEEQPVGIYAHSTGGFLALPFLSRYSHKMDLDWVWLSSPLLKPTHNQSKIKIRASDFLADFFPNLIVPTGVKPSRCFHTEGLDLKTCRKEFENCHSKISVRFGRDLMLWENRVATAATRLKDPLRLLFTQGSEDHICPPEFAETLFRSMPLEDKTFVMLDSLRHEPLREPDNGQFLEAVQNWLTENLKQSELQSKAK